MKRMINIVFLILFLSTGTAFAYKIACVSKDNMDSKTYTVVDVKEQITFKGPRLEEKYNPIYAGWFYPSCRDYHGDSGNCANSTRKLKTPSR
jgi:hypothetical protein